MRRNTCAAVLLALLSGVWIFQAAALSPPPNGSECPKEAEDIPQSRYDSSFSEVAGARYRKIALNGLPMPDGKPQSKEETDEAPEETYIDALSHTLNHSVTDIYIPMGASDLTLSVRRNVQSEVWSRASGLNARDPRPDQPFGAGWNSNLTPHIDFVVSPAPTPEFVNVTDETGAVHRFIVLYSMLFYGNRVYFPMPTHYSQQEEMYNTLVQNVPTPFEAAHNITTYTFTRRYGTKLTFTTQSAPAPISIPADRWGNGPGWVHHTWARLAKLEDKYGTEITYTPHEDHPNSLIPGTITCRGKSITIEQSNRRVTKITDPRGNSWHYAYQTTTVGEIPLPAPLPPFFSGYPVVTLKSVTTPENAVTQYTYNFASEPDPTPSDGPLNEYFFCDIEKITDPVGMEHSFTYVFDHSRYNYKYSSSLNFAGYYTAPGSPRNISQSITPAGTATFNNDSKLYVGRKDLLAAVSLIGQREMGVWDAAGGYHHYSFGDVTLRRADELQDFLVFIDDNYETPWTVTYTSMAILHRNAQGFHLGTETYEFQYDAGMALSKATDLSGNVTTFEYKRPTFLKAKYPFFNQPELDLQQKFLPDPTKEIDALGGVKEFKYNDTWNIMTEAEDQAGNRTLTTIEPDGLAGSCGRRTHEYIYSTTSLDRLTAFEYDFLLRGFVSRKNLGGGAIVTYFEPDAFGNIAEERIVNVGPGIPNVKTEYTYDANNNKTSVKDPRGFITTFTYDKQNRLTQTTFPDGKTKKIAYDKRGRKITETDENDHISRFAYDFKNKLVEQKREMGAGNAPLITTHTYNAYGQKLSTTDPNGGVTTYEYDHNRRLSKMTDAIGNSTPSATDGITLYEYGLNSGGSVFDTSGFKPTKLTEPNGVETTFTYDKLYRETEKSVKYDPGVPGIPGVPGKYAVTQTNYDAVGNPIYVRDPEGKITRTQFDALKQARRVTYHDLTFRTVDYNTAAQKWKETDELGRVTETIYDGAGRPIEVKAPAVDNGYGVVARPTTKTEYDAASNANAVINPLGRRADCTFNNRNRKTKEEQPEVAPGVRPTIETTYDGVGNVVSVKDARGHTSDTTYDHANRVTKVEAPAPLPGQARPTTLTKYDQNGNILELTDPNGNKTTNTYDKMNRLWTTTDAEGMVVENGYDAVGNKTMVKDGKGQVTLFTYDGLKRNLTNTTALGETTEFTYNGVNKTSRKDPLDRVTNYTYDSRHRLATVSYVGRSVDNRVYSYDLVGNLQSVVEPGKLTKADVSYTYDALNRVLTETSGGATHTYKYDLAGNRLSAVYGGGTLALVSTYDALNRLSTLTEAGSVSAYSYDLNGNNTGKVLPNGDTVATAYDALNRSTSITGTKAGGATHYQYAQTRDAVGNVTAITETTANLPARALSMTYDDVYRLLSEVETVGGQTNTTSYTYDNANNRATRTKVTSAGTSVASYGYNAANRLISVNEGTRAQVFDYDAAGNRTVRGENGLDNAFYSYDFENRLIWTGQPIPNGWNDYNYVYDYRTRRVERMEDGIATKVIFSGGTSVREVTASAPTVEYVRGSDWGGGVGGILYTLRGGTPSFTHYDSRGDVTTKTDGAGLVTYQASYEAFGTRTQEHGATADRQKANTKEEDPTGLLNEGMRYRDLGTGTFLTADPAGFVDGPNLYAYVRQNPWTTFDPDGLAEKKTKEPDAPRRTTPTKASAPSNSKPSTHVAPTKTARTSQEQTVIDVVKATPTGKKMWENANPNVEFKSPLGGNYYVGKNNTIHIDPSQQADMQIAQLSHELGHAYLKATNQLQGNPYTQSKDDYVETQLANESFSEKTRMQIYQEHKGSEKIARSDDQGAYDRATTEAEKNVAARNVIDGPYAATAGASGKSYRKKYEDSYDEVQKFKSNSK